MSKVKHAPAEETVLETVKPPYMTKVKVVFPRTHEHPNNCLVIDAAGTEFKIQLTDPQQRAAYEFQRSISRDRLTINVTPLEGGGAEIQIPDPSDALSLFVQGATRNSAAFLERRLEIMTPIATKITEVCKGLKAKVSPEEVYKAATHLTDHVVIVYRTQVDISMDVVNFATGIREVYAAILHDAYLKVSKLIGDPTQAFIIAADLSLSYMKATQTTPRPRVPVPGGVKTKEATT